MEEITVWLTEQNAYQNYPFVHQIGERVKSHVYGREGIVKNAKFEGAGNPDGAFEIIYHIQTDNGDVVKIPMIELEKVKANSKTR